MLLAALEPCRNGTPNFYQKYVNGIKLNVAIIAIMHDTNNNGVFVCGSVLN